MAAPQFEQRNPHPHQKTSKQEGGKEKEANPDAQSSGSFQTNMALGKDGSSSDAASCISTAGDTSVSVRRGDTDVDAEYESVASYPTATYYGYSYSGSYDMENQGYYAGGSPGMEMQYPVVQADNGSFVYLMPGFQPGYDPYMQYLPMTTISSDGQYVGQQMYSPISPIYQPPINSPGYNIPSPLPYEEFSPTPLLWGPSLNGDGMYVNGYNGILETPTSKSNFSSPSHTRAPFSKSYTAPSETKSLGYGARNQTKPVNKASFYAPAHQSEAATKGHSSVAKFSVYNNQRAGGLLYPNNSLKANPKSWGGPDKVKTTYKAYSVRDVNSSCEKNHGPRTINPKSTIVSATDKENEKLDSANSIIRKDQYNLPDFPTKYEQALFFVIKSYSEDDIHKSIKYNVWASTPNGNRRLDNAYQDAHEKAVQRGCKCPIFLFFSVNASGQFCGVAEMVGRVDFNKNMDFWQQDKWNGYFPVKWHVIKDVPNPQLRHIILENNEHKPVTNSRDTQEVKFLQGVEMLNIFKSHLSKTSILDDFDFYESRQKVMKEKRIRQSNPYYDLQPKMKELTITASE